MSETPFDTPKRHCDMPGCQQPAEYRAPKSRQKLRDYYWFCFTHIREYNKNWDYFKGMNASQIEEQLRSSAVWDKPSWKLGQLGKKRLPDPHLFKDPLHILAKNVQHKKYSQNTAAMPAHLQQALYFLEMKWPITVQELKKRYITLARQYHPDTNGENPHLEEKFKQLNAAYSQLRTYLLNKVEAH